MNMERRRGSTKRVQDLLDELLKHGESDRSGEWFTPDMFPTNVTGDYKDEDYRDYEDIPVIVRRSLASKAMLKAMTTPQNSKNTRTFEILPGELIVGIMPLGSLGLGKVFPEYMTEVEKRVSSSTSQDSTNSVFGHNVADYKIVVNQGLKGIIQICDNKIDPLKMELRNSLKPGKLSGMMDQPDDKLAFYKAVRICLEAVVEYANEFAKLAEDEAKNEEDQIRKNELKKIAEICKKVPNEPAETFYEALQSIWFVHLALHSTLNFVSLGRLDQILEPFYERDIKEGRIDEKRALELLECFIIKAAGRLNLNPNYFEKMDHMDYGASLSINPIVIDQYASANNYLQSIVVGGKTRDGKDATNKCTYLFLEAYADLGLFTPTLYVRFHEDSPSKLLEKSAQTLMESDCGLPNIYNDETIIPALSSLGIPLEEARDYVADGCWEPILNAKNDWTFQMINMLTVLECAINGGALLTNNPQYLRGQKMSYLTDTNGEFDFCDKIESFEHLKELVKFHMRFFTDQAALKLYTFYTVPGSSVPTPLLSAFMGGCLEKGIDKTWGGTDYILGGIIADAMPNCANSLAAINEWVYDKKVYSLPKMAEILKNDFYGGKDPMLRDVLGSPKFGNKDPRVDDIMKWLLDEFCDAVDKAKKLADHLFLYEPKNEQEQENIIALRSLAGYSGNSMKEKYGKDFNIIMNAGCGTFESYANMGLGCSASAEGRRNAKPIAPNFTPVSGTDHTGIGHLLSTMDNLGLERFGAGVVIDVCLERAGLEHDYLVKILRRFVDVKGNIISITIADHDELVKIYDLCEDVRNGLKDPSALEKYNQISVRVGGFQSPFVTLTKEQQKDYLKRSISGVFDGK